ncbi:MAG: DoxX family membrane protein [Verrucomicrobia bacterium]|nr:DoxX family membrane protein [Verrucomicrobiota bacterium]
MNPLRLQKIQIWSVVLIRVVLGITFLFAGAIKASASEEFALALVPFSILPESWTGTFAMALAITEIAAGLLILLPRVHRIGSAMILLLALLFIGVLTWALSNGLIVSCGCFGGDETPSASAMQLAIFRDIGIASAAALTLVLRVRPNPKN